MNSFEEKYVHNTTQSSQCITLPVSDIPTCAVYFKILNIYDRLNENIAIAPFSSKPFVVLL